MKKHFINLAMALFLVLGGYSQTIVADCMQYPTSSTTLNLKIDSINNTLSDIGITFYRQTEDMTELEFESLVNGFNNGDQEFLIKYNYLLDEKFETKQTTVLRLKDEAKAMILLVFPQVSDKDAVSMLLQLCKCALLKKRAERKAETLKMYSCKSDKSDCFDDADVDYGICAAAASMIGAASGPFWFLVGGGGILLCIRDYRKDVRSCNKAYGDCINKS
jgi:hypothetical protein